jgi:radical SAM PhpK family P-methyltransferase
MIDCLIIGFNDSPFEDYVGLVKSMGTDSGAYKDLRLAYIDFQGKPYRSMDILNHYYSQSNGGTNKHLHNADFLWPVVTCLGSYLSKRDLTFDYVNLFHLEKDKLKEKLAKNDVLTIAITTTLYVSPHPIVEIIAFIKEHNDTAKILVGGPYINNQPKMGDEETLQRLFDYLGADIYVISSEGETALVNIIQALKTRSSLNKVDNIAYKQDGKYVVTSTSIESNPLETNMVNYGLFPKEEFTEFVTLRTAKSCPFSCSFCGFPQRAGKYKFLGVDLVEQELDAIRNIGTVTTLTFLDDTFNVPKERFKEILRMMINNQYGYKWNSFYRCDHGDEETIELMGKAGCEGVFLGIESGSDQMLKRMNKSARQKDYLKAIPLLRDAGISTHGNLIVGFPGETYETVQQSIQLLEEAKPDFFRAQLWYADPMTPIWKEKDDYGVKGSSFNWSHDTMDYQTACDLVDKMFVAVEGTIWLPQNGFEQWSTFYLQRKGMSLEQIKTFLKCFNAVIKDDLIHPEKKETNPQLLESLKTSCEFNKPARPDMRPIEVLSGKYYTAAEQFWANEFGSPVASNIEAVREKHASEEGWAALTCEVERSVLSGIESRGLDIVTAVLAGYSLLLSRLNGQPDTSIVTAIGGSGETEVFPLRLRPYSQLTFREVAQHTRKKILETIPSRVHAFHILTNPLRMTELNSSCPVFDVAFIAWESNGHQEQNLREEALRLYPELLRRIQLILTVEGNGSNVQIQFQYLKKSLGKETISKLRSYLISILKEVERNADALVMDLGLDDEILKNNRALEALASEAFKF